jgi:hypothetical protein
MNELLSFSTGMSAPLTAKGALLSLVLAFGLAQALATLYVWTFRSMSYSRSFVHAVSLGSIVACMLMLAINNNVAAGLGIAGSLAIIRFRTAMRDPRDMVFVFASMGAGIASGLRAHLVAVVGTLIFAAAVGLITATDFGSQRRFDGLLRFQVPSDTDSDGLSKIIRKHTRYFALVTLRNAAQGQMIEYAYQIELADRRAQPEFLSELQTLQGITDLSLLLQEPTVEI